MAGEAALEAKFLCNTFCPSCVGESGRSVNIYSVDSVELHVWVLVVTEFGSRGTGRKRRLISPSCDNGIGLMLLVLEENGLRVPFIDRFRRGIHPVDAASERGVEIGRAHV